jgi:hypothetical protein
VRFPEAQVLILVALLLCGESWAQTPVPASVPAMSASAVREAVQAVRNDPLLPRTEKVKELRFKNDENKRPDRDSKPDDGRWWVDLLSSFSAGMRVAVWLLGAALLIWILLRLRDWVQQREGGSTPAVARPTHVGTLDIRPESLPADVGGAARAMGRRGEMRAALSLLYRGALSRLVHTHGVPIRAASTESDCLALAAARLAPASQDFLARLVAGWQAVAYAQRELAADAFDQLCTDFDAQLVSGVPA